MGGWYSLTLHYLLSRYDNFFYYYLLKQKNDSKNL